VLTRLLLTRWSSQAVTRDGAGIRIRPLRADDREREIAFIKSLSERTRYFRLFAPTRFLSAHQLDQLMDIDYRSRMAFAATISNDTHEEFVAVARYAQTDRADSVELGVTVTDAWQRRGVGRAVVSELLKFARWRGYRLVIGMALSENHGMIALARSLGFNTSYDPIEHVVHISRELSPSAPLSIRLTGDHRPNL
jgi:RimJ/RimL family protein N-acetyltransferase